jgi:hypothetical protein
MGVSGAVEGWRRRLVVLAEPGSEAAGFDADDGVETGIVAVAPVEDGQAYGKFLQSVEIGVQVALRYVSQKATKPLGANKPGLAEIRSTSAIRSSRDTSATRSTAFSPDEAAI